MLTKQTVMEYAQSKGVAIQWEATRPPLAYYSIKLSRGDQWSDMAIGTNMPDDIVLQKVIYCIDVLSGLNPTIHRNN